MLLQENKGMSIKKGAQLSISHIRQPNDEWINGAICKAWWRSHGFHAFASSKISTDGQHLFWLIYCSNAFSRLWFVWKIKAYASRSNRPGTASVYRCYHRQEPFFAGKKKQITWAHFKIMAEENHASHPTSLLYLTLQNFFQVLSRLARKNNTCCVIQ